MMFYDFSQHRLLKGQGRGGRDLASHTATVHAGRWVGIWHYAFQWADKKSRWRFPGFHRASLHSVPLPVLFREAKFHTWPHASLGILDDEVDASCYWGLLCFNGQNNREKAWMMMTLFFLSPFSYLCLLEEVIRCIGALHQSYCSFVWWCIEMLAWWMKFIGTSGCDRWHARLYGVRNIWNDFVVIRDMKGAKFCSWKN